MINREQVSKILDVMDQMPEESVELVIKDDGKCDLRIYPKNWWNGEGWPEEKRHQMLALVTPLIGKLEKHLDGTNIGYSGKKDNVSIRMNYIDQCKIVGYKTVTKTVQKEIRPAEYEEVEEEQKIAITDCDIRQGKFLRDDIEAAV